MSHPQYVHMNQSTGIGQMSNSSSSRAHHSDYDDPAGYQANTANPFKKQIIEILQSKIIPSQAALENLLGYLGNQEDKLHALNCDMIPTIFKIYDQCHQSDETIMIRGVLVRMLRSFCILSYGRQLLFANPGMSRVLTLLNDASELVRKETCDMLETLTSFPDVKKHIALDSRATLSALVNVFLHDPSQLVTDATLSALEHLTRTDPLLDELVLKKLAGVIVRAAANSESDRIALQLLHTALQVAWNVSLNSREKEIAIGVGMVDVVAPLLEAERQAETRRGASGLLSSLAIAQAGKLAILNHPGTVAQACKLTLNKNAAIAGGSVKQAVRANSVSLIRNFAEAPRGLEAVGSFLLPDPDTMLEVLGPDQSSCVIGSRLTVKLLPGVEAFRKSVHDELEHVMEPPEVSYTLRALYALLKYGPSGVNAAWNILNIVPRLYERVVYDPPASASKSVIPGGPTLHETVSAIRSTASRCLQLLCEENDDARVELMNLKDKLGLASSGKSDVFALVEGAYLKVKQARLAAEAKQREEEEAAALRAAQEAEAMQRALEEEARIKEEERKAAEAAEAERAAAAEANGEAKEGEENKEAAAADGTVDADASLAVATRTPVA